MPFGKTMLSKGAQNRPEEELRFKLRGFLEETEEEEGKEEKEKLKGFLWVEKEE